MADYGMTIEQLQQREDIQALLTQVTMRKKSQYVASMELTASGIPRYLSERLVDEVVEPVGVRMQRKWREMNTSAKNVKQDMASFDNLDKFHIHAMLTRLLIFFLVLNILAAVPVIYDDLNERSLLISMQDDSYGVTQQQLEDTNNLQSQVRTFRTFIYLATVMVFLQWFYISYENIEAFKPYKPRFGVNWTWLGFIIPILNMWRPVQVAREIWNASAPDVDIKNDRNWQYNDAHIIVTIWWPAFILGSRFLHQYIRSTFDEANTVADLITRNMWSLVAEVAGIYSAVVTIAFVYMLASRQWGKYGRLVKERNSLAIQAN